MLLAGAALLVFGLQGALAQGGQGQYPQSGEEDQDAQEPRSQIQTQESRSLLHGFTIGAGLAIYQGDYSLNPNHNVVKYIAGSGKLSFQVGLDHRLGRFDQYTLGADLVYSRLSGQGQGAEFSVNTLALDFYADYELPYISDDLFRVFLGGGPILLLSPNYSGTPGVMKEENYQRLGTRVIGSLKLGVTIMDSFRVGTRVASTDLLDGYKGFVADGVPDFVSFLNIRYRFNLEE